MSDRTKLNIAVCIENAVTLMCFTALAIVFKIWWLVFLSALFFTKVERGEQ